MPTVRQRLCRPDRKASKPINRITSNYNNSDNNSISTTSASWSCSPQSTNPARRSAAGATAKIWPSRRLWSASANRIGTALLVSIRKLWNPSIRRPMKRRRRRPVASKILRVTFASSRRLSIKMATWWRIRSSHLEVFRNVRELAGIRSTSRSVTAVRKRTRILPRPVSNWRPIRSANSSGPFRPPNRGLAVRSEVAGRAKWVGRRPVTSLKGTNRRVINNNNSSELFIAMTASKATKKPFECLSAPSRKSSSSAPTRNRPIISKKREGTIENEMMEIYFGPPALHVQFLATYSSSQSFWFQQPILLHICMKLYSWFNLLSFVIILYLKERKYYN